MLLIQNIIKSSLVNNLIAEPSVMLLIAKHREDENDEGSLVFENKVY